MPHLFLFCPHVVGGRFLGLDLDGDPLDYLKAGPLQSIQFIGVI